MCNESIVCGMTRVSRLTGAFYLLSLFLISIGSKSICIRPYLASVSYLYSLNVVYFCFISFCTKLCWMPLSGWHVAAMRRRALKQETSRFEEISRFEDISGWLNWKKVIGTNTGCSTGANKTILPEQIQSTESLTVVTATKTWTPRGRNHFMIPFEEGHGQEFSGTW